MSTTLRIVFISDIHDKFYMLEKIMPKISDLKPDLILWGGDFQTHETQMFVLPEIQKQNTEFIDKCCDLTSKVAPTYCVLGNHDAVLTCDSKYFITQPVIFRDFEIVPQSGTSSALLEDLQFEQLVKVQNFWEAYPWGPLLEKTEQMEQFLQFEAPRLKENSCKLQKIKQNEFLDRIESYPSYNKNQVFPEYKAKNIIVLSHQGPYCSTSACDIYNGKWFSSGSPNNQQFYDLNSQNITLWLHGHTHGPVYHQCRQMVNPGSLYFGKWCCVDLICENGEWGIDDVQFFEEKDI